MHVYSTCAFDSTRLHFVFEMSCIAGTFFLISLIIHALKPADIHVGWVHMFKISLIVLASVVGALNIIAILKNIQFTKNKI